MTRHVADAERDGHGIEARFLEGQFFRIGLAEIHLVGEAALLGALAPHRQHLGVDVRHHGPRTGAARRHGAEGHIPGATSEILRRKGRSPCGGRSFEMRHSSTPGAGRRT